MNAEAAANSSSQSKVIVASTVRTATPSAHLSKKITAAADSSHSTSASEPIADNRLRFVGSRFPAILALADIGSCMG
jgi:hypothetical protein